MSTAKLKNKRNENHDPKSYKYQLVVECTDNRTTNVLGEILTNGRRATSIEQVVAETAPERRKAVLPGDFLAFRIGAACV